jgi:hypothetical protein
VGSPAYIDILGSLSQHPPTQWNLRGGIVHIKNQKNPPVIDILGKWYTVIYKCNTDFSIV